MTTIIPVARNAAVTVMAFSFFAASAMAAETTIGEASVVVPPPSGFCELSDGQSTDARMLTAIRETLRPTGNQLLAMSADCEQLSAWRTGGRLLDDIAQYQAPKDVTSAYTPDVLKQICALTRQQGDKMAADLMPDMKKRVEEVVEAVKLNEVRFIGVVDEDATGCYVAMLQKFKTELGTDKTQVAVYAITIVKGKLVFYYLFRNYESADTAPAMLAVHKSNVAALLAANR